MTKARSGFKMPEARAEVQEWVDGKTPAAASKVVKPAARIPAGVKQARLTIDLPQDLHAKFKSVCALKQTRMVDEVTTFIQEWTQKNGYTDTQTPK